MANIFTISGSYFGTASWSDPTLWDGGILPTSSDVVFIRGVRTTINQNIGNNVAQFPWSGSVNIRVANQTDFPPTGSFYTHTDRDEEIKINYGFLSSSVWFGDCVVDTTYNSWSLDLYPETASVPDKRGGFIPNGAFVQFRPGTVIIDNLNITASTLIIENGGDLLIRNNTTMSLGDDSVSVSGKLLVRDGKLVVTGSNLIKWNYNYKNSGNESNDNNVNYIIAENFPMSYMHFEGPEVRTNTTLVNSASVGDHYLEVNDVSDFEAEDIIFVGEEEITSQKESDDTLNFSSSYYVSSDDETFRVVGKDTGSNYLYIHRTTGLDGIIKASSSATEYLVDDQRYQVGDKVLINNQLRTITAIENDVDYLLRDYDFAGGSDLTDWETDVTRSLAFSDWAYRPGLGLTQHTTNLYRHTFVKDLMLDNVKVEAFVSNFRNINFGIVDRREFGIYIQSEPQSDNDYGAPVTFQNTLRTSLSYDLTNTRAFMRHKFHGAGYIDKTLSGNLALNGPKKLTLEFSREFLKGYINDEQIFEELSKTGPSWGRVGLYTNGNNSFTCTRFKVYAKYQKITLDSSVSAAIGDKVYETGVEEPHVIGDKVIKLASVVTDPLQNKNLAFAYIGAEEYDSSSIYPYIASNNLFSGKNAFFNNYYRLTNAMPGIYEYDLGAGVDRSTIIDLCTPTSFSVVGFVEGYYSNGQRFTIDAGISISGSNDNINWTAITGGLDNRYKVDGQGFRTWDVGSQVYRYIRIETNGETIRNFNRIRGYLVQNITASVIEVNNTSDLAVGDEIVIMPKGSYGPFTAATNYTSILDSDPSAEFASDYLTQHFTITGKSGNQLTLDRYYKSGYIQKGTTIVKVNRLLSISGSFDWNNNKMHTGRIGTVGGTNAVRRYSFKNVSFQHVNGQYPNRSTATTSGFYLNEYNYYSYLAPFQGCTLYNNFSGQQYHFGIGQRSGYTMRHNFISNSTNTIYFFSYNNPFWALPIVISGNIINAISMAYFTNNRSIEKFNHNIIIAANTYAIPTFSQTLTNAFQPYTTIIEAKRNWAITTNEGINFSHGHDGVGSSYVFKIENNRFENIINTSIRLNTLHDKDFNNPIIFAKRGGLDTYKRAPLSTSTTGWASYWIQSTNLPYNNVPVAINNFNRLGYQMRWHYLGRWVKDERTSYQKFYRFPQQANYYAPILGTIFWLEEGVSASFDLNFDYFTPKEIELQRSGINSGSAVVFATKNGAQLLPLQILTPSTIPLSFNSTYQITGPGLFQFAIGGMDTDSGYLALNNITSRILAPNPEQNVSVNINTLNMRYFGNGNKTMLKTAYVQGEQDAKFRLQGLRIF